MDDPWSDPAYLQEVETITETAHRLHQKRDPEQLEKYPEAEQVLLVAENILGVVGNGGFRFFCEQNMSFSWAISILGLLERQELRQLFVEVEALVVSVKDIDDLDFSPYDQRFFAAERTLVRALLAHIEANSEALQEGS